MTATKIDFVLVVMLALAAGLMLIRLDNGMMWQDEAETAMLARNVLRFGVPQTVDGTNTVNPDFVFRDDGLWTYHPWLQFYLVALSFKLFGESTWSARFPFAVFGIVSVWLTYGLALRLLERRSWARMTTLLVALSVPFILHARQCRYYTLSTALGVWLVLIYLKWLEGRRGQMGWALLAALLLFHTNHGVFIPVIGTLGLHYLICTARPIPRKDLVWGTGLLAVLTGPWWWFLQSGQHVRALEWINIRHNLEYHIRQLNHYLIPLAFWLGCFLLRLVPGRACWQALTVPAPRRLLILMPVVGLVFLVVIRERMFRYLIYLVPWLAMIQAIWLGVLWQRRRWAAVALTGLILVTDVLHYSGGYALASAVSRDPQARAKARPRSLLTEYVRYELREPYRGPLEGVVPYLVAHARPTDTVKIPNETHSVMFYTGLRVENEKVFGESYTSETFPDWIILHRGWLPDGFFDSSYFRAIQAQYKRIELDVPDLMWQNRPDPGYHLFRTATDAPKIVLYRRRSS